MRSTNGIVSLVLRVASLFLVAGCAFGTLRSKPGTTTTVILLRHADRSVGSDELNDKGRERAEALVGAVSGMGVTAIYSPDVKRNLDTRVGRLARVHARSRPCSPPRLPATGCSISMNPRR
jgi:hypothetical protein